ncbi:short chain isoprenyl diphosphate synthase IdsA [Methanobrevibacter boviskoreani]|uniref:short chain isoprenyl diphosphate synthase IdsA n=1 Tax=Methanobrevibacter boviskoreani TaxID=1348249 RepID=UPI0023A812FC|nr:short chain isoprenyl diphosphate synthase IdsA [Methanobrevibacter boviskoreani]MCI6774479.1 short chain isoprenyl diphosphate synthase IdsA [Methanobrevibacter boviskoreani]MCI6929685.1 short chain isoprenyl diphosphate synthase IdsA [Methanobrevibacter boviskoreani]MDY5613996.1 short chain isoprenyl diphosphate synthase IdsA [Methanobrevibacter boviskoreani]
MSDVTEILTDYSKDVKAVIEDYLSNIDPEDLQKSSVYLTEAGGKMLRPALTLLSSQAVGGNREDALKTAAAFEMIHTFSLIHDDIMDDDDMRRGKPSVHTVWGEPLAILAGDTLFSKAFGLVITSKEDNISADRVAESLAVVADACVKICEGQALDMGFEGNFDVQEEEYMEMIFKKTAALIAGACKAGAIVGGADSEVIDAMYEYGRLIGLAFQIQDDYLDVISDEKDLGKPVGSDIVEGKMTLMVVKALSEANEEDKEKLVKILSDPESPQEDVDIAIDLFNKYGSIEYAHDVALSNVNKAKEILNILPNSSSKDALALLADFVIERKS